MTLLELAERVEALDGPDREVDALVGRYKAADFLGTLPADPQYGCARYTASIDAAMQLKPEGWVIETLSYWPKHSDGEDSNIGARVSLFECSEGNLGIGHYNDDLQESSTAATPALALTAASLRARAAMETNDGPS